MKDLSVIILSYNTKDITRQCLESLHTALSAESTIKSQVIVLDNASQDDSERMISQFVAKQEDGPITYEHLQSKTNLGFVGGNNKALTRSNGRYVLYLNSDVIVNHIDFASIIDYMDNDQHIAALTVRVELPSGQIDPASHRGFPTPWNAFCYYGKLEKTLGKTPIVGSFFGGYHLTHLNLNTIHEIDSPSGAFFLTKKSVLDTLGGFDEDYFMYGEDLDLAFRIKARGYKIMYYPKYKVTHLKHSSGLQKNNTKVQETTRGHFYDAMRIFYRKHYDHKYPGWFNRLMYKGIHIKHSSHR